MIFPMIHFIWQINNLDIDSKNDPISKFKSNVYVGIMLCIICFLNYFLNKIKPMDTNDKSDKIDFANDIIKTGKN